MGGVRGESTLLSGRLKAEKLLLKTLCWAGNDVTGDGDGSTLGV